MTLRSFAKKYSPIYKLKVTYTAPNTGTRWEDKEIEGSFTQWFNTHGYLQAKELQAWLATNIEVLGQAESDRAKNAKKERIPVMMPAKVEEAALDAAAFSSGADAVDGNANASGVPPSAKKSRPKKKA